MRPEIFDVVIVGSGVAGGTAAQELCRAGLKVLMVEAGPAVTAEGLAGRSRSPEGERVQGRCYALSNHTYKYFVDDRVDRYATAPGHPFSWIRSRIVGGRSILWAGHCYRMKDEDFKAGEIDGLGPPWPLSYAEIAPYYDRAEAMLNVHSAPDHKLDHDAVRHIPREATIEPRLKGASESLRLELVAARISERCSPPEANLECVHCGNVGDDCLRPVTSSGSTLAAALRTGRLTIWTDCPVERVSVDSSGKARGILGFRRGTGQSFEALARIVFLCASSLESTRILLNSSSPFFPHGLANSSGVLGRYLMDHVSGVTMVGICEDAGRLIAENSRAGMSYMARYADPRTLLFKRSYGYQLFTMRADHKLLPCARTEKTLANPFAAKDACIVRMAAFGEMLPRYDNYVEIDPEGGRDEDGIPVLKIVCSYGENEQIMARDMASFGAEFLRAARADILEIQDVPSEPGLAIHEAGTCRMGSDPATSVLNAFNQSHDVPNLFVTDASCFPSIGRQNPVLTIVALTLRACEHAMEEMRRGNV